MLKFKFIVLKIKSLIIPFSIYIFTIFLILFSNNNLEAAKAGITLWANSILPSLLPFFIATELLGYTNFVSTLGKLLNKIMRPLFNVPGEGAFALLMGIISGYPVGAKIVANFKKQGICNNIECERLLAFTNNSGPLFIIGTVGISFFSSADIGFLLFSSHILACLTVAFLFRWWKNQKNSNNSRYLNDVTVSNNIAFSNLGELLSKSILNSINLVVMIGGFVVLFSVIISMLKSSNLLYIFSQILNPFLSLIGVPLNYSQSIVTGILEITNGISSLAIPNSNMSIIIASFLLGFGGISVLLQVLSITSKANISIKPYIIGKFLQAIFSVIYTILMLN